MKALSDVQVEILRRLADGDKLVLMDDGVQWTDGTRESVCEWAPLERRRLVYRSYSEESEQWELTTRDPRSQCKCGVLRTPQTCTRNRQTKDGLAMICRDCNKRASAQWKEENPEKYAKWERQQREKRQEERQKRDWLIATLQKALTPICRDDVVLLKSRKYRRKFDDGLTADARKRLSKLWATYGLTGEQYDAMALSQNDRCAICGEVETWSGDRLKVDHHQDSGAVRALLCHGCNVALGFLREDVRVARQVVAYMERFAELGIMGKTVLKATKVA